MLQNARVIALTAFEVFRENQQGAGEGGGGGVGGGGGGKITHYPD